MDEVKTDMFFAFKTIYYLLFMTIKCTRYLINLNIFICVGIHFFFATYSLKNNYIAFE